MAFNPGEGGRLHGIPMLEEQERVSGYQDGPVVSEGGRSKLTPGTDPNIAKLLKVVDDDDDWDFNNAIGGGSVHRGCVKRKMLNLEDECRDKRRKVSMKVGKVIELAQNLLQ